MKPPSIQILSEDQEILVINKPSGLLTVPAGAFRADALPTVAGWVRQYLGEGILGVGQEGRLGLVHRLDRDTSGVMVVAKTQSAYQDLAYQFRERLVKKKYLALVWGDIRSDAKFPISKNSRAAQLKYDWLNRGLFEVKAPIGRNPRDPLKFAVVKGGKGARTTFSLCRAYYGETFSI